MTITLSASGARDLWQLVDAPCVQELGGAANGAPVRDLPLPMPEYLHPGVYLEEVPFEGRPIDGVPTSAVDPAAHLLSGPGIVGGLAVDADPPGQSSPVNVSPGRAIGPDGRDLHPLASAAMRRFGAA